jgi:hypothetical protein
MTCAALCRPGWPLSASKATRPRCLLRVLLSYFGADRDFFLRFAHCAAFSPTASAALSSHCGCVGHVTEDALLVRRTLPFKTASNSWEAFTRPSARSTQIRIPSKTGVAS